MHRMALTFFFHDSRLFLRYVLAGGAAAMIEFGLFALFNIVLGWPLLLANSTALAVAIFVAFTLQKHWTFRTKGEDGRQFKLYLIMQGISALLNNLLMLLFVTGWAWSPPIAKVVEIGLLFVWNFSFCKLVIFQPSKMA
jgi:putative flippase GtrA